jgi:thiamine-phosphate pyrophosphorylase
VTVPAVHVICPDEVMAEAGFVERASEILNVLGSDGALHLRGRSLSVRDLLDRAVRLAEPARRSGGWIVVNGRVDVALAGGVRAVQLGAGALPVDAARRVLGADARIGASVHGTAEARERAREGADFLLVGTIFHSASHPGGEPGGVERVRACASFGLPVVAIGGITVEKVPLVRAAGACGIAAIRAVWTVGDATAAAAGLRAALRER